MAQDVNGKALKVGDKVKALTNGGFGCCITVGGIYNVTSIQYCGDGMGAHIGDADLYMCASEIELVEEATTKGSDMFKFKVGDKVVLKEAGVIGRSVYVDEILNRVSEYGFLEVTEVGVGIMQDGYAISIEGLYYKPNQLWVNKATLEDHCKLKEEPKLTPKLIESLVELEIGDYFKVDDGSVFHVMGLNTSDGKEYHVLTDYGSYNLTDLQELKAYKVKVEPLEMVEVIEEVKPKLYELVEGQDYVKLERGDIIKFKDGNVHGVHAVDEDDNAHPYCMYFISDSWWVESHYFLPENIISINGVNIHEEATEKDPYEGWVAGARVKCITDTLSCYEVGEVYTLGTCLEDGNFGVRDGCDYVMGEGHIRDSEGETEYKDREAYKHFELIKE